MSDMVKMEPGEFLPDFFTRINSKIKIADDVLFCKVELLDKLPQDWTECVFFLIAQNYEGSGNEYVIILDDEKTKKAMHFIKLEKIRIYVADDNDNKMWEVFLMEQKGKRVFGGGENLRQFCDRRNIYYRSFYTDTGLISGTDMQYEKNEDEDCRISFSED